MSVVEGVREELAGLPVGLAPGLRALALAMAESIDSGRGSRSECGKVLSDTLSKLRDLAPPKQEASRLDELTARRRKRLAGGAGSAD